MTVSSGVGRRLDQLAGTRAARASRSVSSSSSVMPMMPFIGVRISWLMLARNSLLARLAASAASLAWRRAVLGRLAVGDVLHLGHDQARPTGRVTDQGDVDLHPHRVAGLVQVPLLPLVRADLRRPSSGPPAARPPGGRPDG